MSFPRNIHIDWCDVGQVTIDTLSDDALLYVFDFYVAQAPEVETWHLTVHVCRRWRTLVFASPRRLNLRIAWRNTTPIRETLDIWPILPIVVSGDCYSKSGIDKIKAALKLNDRVSDQAFFEVEIGQDPCNTRGTVPGVNGSGPVFICESNLEPSLSQYSQVLGWVYPSAITFINWHSDSGITKATFVFHRPCQSSH
jgi:hypothetical protein